MGTESAFLEDAGVLTVSVHQDRCYPVDSGQMHVTGAGAAAGTNLNVPLPPGCGHGAAHRRRGGAGAEYPTGPLTPGAP